MTGMIKKLFKPKVPTIAAPTPDPTPIPVPEVTPAPVMPDSDAVEVNRAKVQEVRRRMQRGGRQSTIMSQGAGAGDGDSYSRSTLG